MRKEENRGENMIREEWLGEDNNQDRSIRQMIRKRYLRVTIRTAK